MRSELARVALFVVLALATGCLSFCECQPFLDKARSGDPAGLVESGELGRPRVPSSAKPLARIDEAFDAVRPSASSKDPYLRELAIDSLRHLAERAPDFYRNRYPDLFDAALKDELPSIRWRAAWAMGRIPASNEALKAAIADKDDDVAEMACWAVGRARDDSALRQLGLALDRSPVVRAAALTAIGRLTGAKLGDDLAAWKKFCEDEAKRLEKVAEERRAIEAAANKAAATPPDTAPVATPTKPKREN